MKVINKSRSNSIYELKNWLVTQYAREQDECQLQQQLLLDGEV